MKKMIFVCGLATVLAIVFVLLLTISPYSLALRAQGTTIYVDVSNMGFEDGTQAHPFNTIQEGVDYAVDGDTVLVLPGIYVENVTIEDKSVTLRSKLGPAVTVIDGNASSSVVKIFSTSKVTNATIDGFTIQNGGASGPWVEDGYGVVTKVIGSLGYSATIQNNTITENNLNGGIGVLSGPVVEVLITNNRIMDGGPGVYVEGGTTGFVTIQNNIIASNEANPTGAGLWLFGNSGFAINVFNNTVYSNTAIYGGGLGANSSDLNLVNNVFFMNTAQQEGDDLYLVQQSLSATVTFNIIGDGQFDGVDGNFSADPLFVDPANGNFHLQSGSPAIDAGTTVSVDVDFEGDARPYDGDGVGGAQWDIGADEKYPPLWHSTKTINSSTALPGNPLTYTITVNNDDPVNVTNVRVTDTLPISLTYVENSLAATSGSYGYNTGVITWTGSVSVGSAVDITFGATVSPTLPLGTSIVNTAVISGGGQMITRTATVDIAAQVFLPIIARNYCPDFFDDFSIPASGWEVVDDSSVRTEYLNGEYRILTKKAGYVFLFQAPTCDRQNYVMEADARWVGTPGNSYGLGFGITADFGQFYLFRVNTDFREFLLLRRDAGGFTTIVAPTYSAAINGGTASNHLKVTRNGDQITLEVNGTVLGTWSDGTITGFTGAGIVSSSYSNNPTSDARFDNFSVISLLGSGATAHGLGGAAAEVGDLQISGAYRALADIDQWPRRDDVEPEIK